MTLVKDRLGCPWCGQMVAVRLSADGRDHEPVDLFVAECGTILGVKAGGHCCIGTVIAFAAAGADGP